MIPALSLREAILIAQCRSAQHFIVTQSLPPLQWHLHSAHKRLFFQLNMRCPLLGLKRKWRARRTALTNAPSQAGADK